MQTRRITETNPFDMFDRLMSNALSVAKQTTLKSAIGYSYPPHNVIELPDGNIQLSVSIAGFKKSEIAIQVSQTDRSLSITGSKSGEEQSPVYLYKGLATRAFELKWRIPESLEVQDDATIEDGVLNVILKKVNLTNTVKTININ